MSSNRRSGGLFPERKRGISPFALETASALGGVSAGLVMLVAGGGYGLLACLPAALVTWGAIRFGVLRPYNPAKRMIGEVTEATLLEELEIRRKSVFALEECFEQIDSYDEVSDVLEQIIIYLQKILERLSGDLEDVPRTNDFFDNYVPRAVAVVESYLEAQYLDNPKARELRERIATETLPLFRKECERQYNMLLDEEVSRYDTDARVLEKMSRVDEF